MRFDHPATKDPIERLARKRAGARLGWYLHACIYVLVNLLLIFLSVSGGRHWAIYPALGWGLGLAVHGTVVFLQAGGLGLYERLVEVERDRLARRTRTS